MSDTKKFPHPILFTLSRIFQCSMAREALSSKETIWIRYTTGVRRAMERFKCHQPHKDSLARLSGKHRSIQVLVTYFQIWMTNISTMVLAQFGIRMELLHFNWKTNKISKIERLHLLFSSKIIIHNIICAKWWIWVPTKIMWQLARILTSLVKIHSMNWYIDPMKIRTLRRRIT